jgi:hypothetical protein
LSTAPEQSAQPGQAPSTPDREDVDMEAKSEFDDSEQKCDAVIERWLHESVIPAFDRMMKRRSETP